MVEPRVWLVLHSGSRNIGKCLAEAHIKIAKELYGQGMGSGRIGKQLGFDNKTILKAIQQEDEVDQPERMNH